MEDPALHQPIDYLLVGHVTKDLTPEGPILGGTVSYAGLTARALGLRVGVVTSCGQDLDLSPLSDLAISRLPAKHSTTFENVYTPEGRIQTLRARARDLTLEAVPPAWRRAPIIHLAPLCQEVDPDLVHQFPGALIGVTPQGWMRTWDQAGRVFPTPWEGMDRLLPRLGAVVLSIEDVAWDEDLVAAMAQHAPLLVVTEGPLGARVFVKGRVTRVPTPPAEEVDPTGAGDIFAACFFARLRATSDPFEAARYANQLASASVTRVGVASVPTPEEVAAAEMQVG